MSHKLIQAADLGYYNNDQMNRVYDPEGIAPTIESVSGGGREPKIIQEEPLHREGRHRKACEVLSVEGITTCIHTQSNNLLQKVKEPRSFRVRKLTPRECWRLMGWTDEQFDKAKWYTKEESEELLRKYPNHKGKRQFEREGRIERMSDSQLYKQAGNGIVIQVLEAIFRRMFLEQAENSVQPNPDGQMEFIF